MSNNLTVDPEYGFVIDVDKVEQADPIEEKIKELELPTTITLKLAGSAKERLRRLCDDRNLTLDEFIQSLVNEALSERIGRPVINKPSVLGDTPIGEPKSVKGYVGGLVTRG